MDKSWQIKKLGMVIQLHYGKGIPKHDRKTDGKYPIYGANGELGRTDKYLVEGKAIIVGRKGSAGELTRVSGRFWPSDVTYYILDNEQVNIDFLYYLLKNIDLTKLATGVKPGINRNKVYELDGFLPPIDEQIKITKKLEKIFSRIEQIQKLRQQALITTNDLKTSILREVFDVTRERERERESRRLGEVCRYEGGTQPPKSTFIYEPREGYVRLLQIRDYKSDYRAVYIPQNVRHKTCDETDIMIGRYGPPVFQILKGKVGAYNVALMKCIPDERKLLKSYLYYFLKSQPVQDRIISLSTRVRQAGVRPDDLDELEIPLPPLDQQHKIIEKLDYLTNKAETLQTLQGEQLQILEFLKQSTLNQTLKGN